MDSASAGCRSRLPSGTYAFSSRSASGTYQPAGSRSRRRGLAVAVLASVALHALLALGLWVLPWSGSRSVDDGPLAEIPVVVVPVEEFSVSLAEESPPRKANDPPAKLDSETDPEPIRVAALPLISEASHSLEEQAPRVVSSSFGPGPSIIGSRTSPGSGDAGPTFFGVPVQARSVVFLIDRSISMGLTGGLDAAKRELRDCLEHLPSATRFQVLFYNRATEAMPTSEPDGLLANDGQARKSVLQLALGIRAEGGTDHATALRRAIALRCDAVLLITDGEDLKPQQVRTLTLLARGQTAIHAFEWSRSADANEPLQALARLNRGTYRKLGSQFQSRRP